MMNDTPQPSISELLGNRSLISAALGRGVRAALLRHAQAGNPVATWKEGKVVWIQPAEIFTLLAQFPEEPRG
jgi:hypothetical protein